MRLVLTAARLKVKVFQKVETRRQVKSNPLTLVEKVKFDELHVILWVVYKRV